MESQSGRNGGRRKETRSRKETRRNKGKIEEGKEETKERI